jgi:hypothetical protein
MEVSTNIIFLKKASEILCTKSTPVSKPNTVPGSSIRKIFKLSGVMVFQTKTWKGSLNRFMKKNSHAAVPIK